MKTRGVSLAVGLLLGVTILSGCSDGYVDDNYPEPLEAVDEAPPGESKFDPMEANPWDADVVPRRRMDTSGRTTCVDVTSFDYNWDNDMLCTRPDGSQFYTSYGGAALEELSSR